ncbi:hypothetical protein D3C76_1271550 [compost metagenome]
MAWAHLCNDVGFPSIVQSLLQCFNHIAEHYYGKSTAFFLGRVGHSDRFFERGGLNVGVAVGQAFVDALLAYFHCHADATMHGHCKWLRAPHAA